MIHTVKSTVLHDCPPPARHTYRLLGDWVVLHEAEAELGIWLKVLLNKDALQKEGGSTAQHSTAEHSKAQSAHATSTASGSKCFSAKVPCMKVSAQDAVQHSRAQNISISHQHRCCSTKMPCKGKGAAEQRQAQHIRTAVSTAKCFYTKMPCRGGGEHSIA
jgi:hypothetical protein